MTAARNWAHRNQVLLDSLFILAFALALRLPNLEGWPRPQSDEGFYGYIGYDYFQGQLGTPYHFPIFYTPFMMWLFGMMTSIFGRSFLVLRLPGVILGSFTCLLLYLVGRRLFGRGVGLLGAIFLALASTYPNRSALLDNGMTFFLMLALWGYLKLKEQPQGRWGGLIGIAAGLSVLSKSPGVMTPLFVFLQWLVDRKLPTRPLLGGLVLFAALAAIYPLLGAIGGWNELVSDLIPPYRRVTEEVASLTEALLLQRPTSQLEGGDRFGFNLWATGGFLSLFYLLGRGPRGGPVFTYVAAVVTTYVLIGSNFWWAFLIPLYPAYSLALAVVVRDSLVRPGIPFLALFLFLLLLPTFVGGDIEGWGLPPGWGRWGFLLLLALIILGLLVRRLGTTLRSAPSAGYASASWPPTLLRGLTTLVIGISIIAASVSNLRPLFSDDTADMRQVAAYLQANLRADERAGVALPVVYLLGEPGIPYTDVAFYTTRIEFGDYTLADRYPRYNQDISLERMTYFVLDTPFIGLREWNAVLEPYLTATWSQVAAIGDYQVYKNPAFPAKTVPVRDDNLADATQATVALSDHLVVRNDAAEKQSGQDSLRIDLDLKEEHALYLYTVTEPEDWSAVESISFWWYGDRVGLVSLDLMTLIKGSYYRLSFVDNWQGWRQVELPLAEAAPTGTPTGKAIRGLALKFQSLPASGTVRLDELRLHLKPS